MSRKPRENSQSQPKRQNYAINVEHDLAEMLNIISARRKVTIKEMVDGWIRPLVMKSYVDVMRELNEMAPKTDK